MHKSDSGVDEMSNRKSQLTIPVNATTLFTTVVGFIIIAMLTTMFDMPKKLDDNIKATQNLGDKVDKIIEVNKETDKSVSNHEKRIQSIEDTRFTRHDAEELQRRTVDSITQALVPISQIISRNERDITKLENELDYLGKKSSDK